MRTIDGLKKVAKAFAKHFALPFKTLSYRVFDDGKKLDAILAGETDLTTSRHDAAMKWFADNWPEDLGWPADVARPGQRAA